MHILGIVLLAAIELLSPADGARWETLPAAQRAVMAQPTRNLRRNAAACETGPWGCSSSLVLKWKVTSGESGPWKIRIGTTPDLASGVDHWILNADIFPDRKGVFAFEVPCANLELDRTYYWRVWSNVKCSKWTCWSAIGPKGCACGATGPAPASSVWSFKTGDVPPRWIAIEGRTKNIRDLGGWRTVDGRRVRQGRAFRGEALNDNSVNGDAAGRNRLTVEDVHYLTKTLGIRTDLDLRTPREVSKMTHSPLGPEVALVHRSSSAYKEIFSEKGMKAMAENVRLFCDGRNYPIYFHCIGGADRTGSLAYVLNGVLGVDGEDLKRDWESTFYPEVPDVVENVTGKTFENETYWRSTQHFDKGFAKYARPGDALKDRIEAYLIDCGVTKGEIARLRALLLEP